MEKNGRFRKKKVNYAMVSNSIIRNDDISLKAKGLYALIQSYITIEGFTLYKWFLQSKCKEGRKAFESAWSELKQSGYLVQYRMQDKETKRFYWEYELLDEIEAEKPLPLKGGYGSKDPLPQKGYYGQGKTWHRDAMENVGNINNNEISNTNDNNINLINLDDVMEQIDYYYLPDDQKEKGKEIVLLIAEVMNMPDDTTIRIAKVDRPAKEVKQRFRMLNQFHIQYVIGCMNGNNSKIANIKNYILTCLYNAVATMDSYYTAIVNNDMYGQ